MGRRGVLKLTCRDRADPALRRAVRGKLTRRHLRSSLCWDPSPGASSRSCRIMGEVRQRGQHPGHRGHHPRWGRLQYSFMVQARPPYLRKVVRSP
jgi:hypothetical protein